MGVSDRDYMKKHRDEVRRRSRSTEEKAEDIAADFLARHPRFLVQCGIGLGLLIVIAIILSALTGDRP